MKINKQAGLNRLKYNTIVLYIKYSKTGALAFKKNIQLSDFCRLQLGSTWTWPYLLRLPRLWEEPNDEERWVTVASPRSAGRHHVCEARRACIYIQHSPGHENYWCGNNGQATGTARCHRTTELHINTHSPLLNTGLHFIFSGEQPHHPCGVLRGANVKPRR